MTEAGPITTAEVMADSRSPSARIAATRKARPAALARIDRPPAPGRGQPRPPVHEPGQGPREAGARQQGRHGRGRVSCAREPAERAQRGRTTRRAAAPSSSRPRWPRGCSPSRRRAARARARRRRTTAPSPSCPRIALLLAESGELGLQALASRGARGREPLAALARPRAPRPSGSWPSPCSPPSRSPARRSRPPPSALGGLAALPLAPVLCLLVFWFAFSGWGEFLGVALRCRGARVQEALLLLCLRPAGSFSPPRRSRRGPASAA